jgi:hypothetical protein
MKQLLCMLFASAALVAGCGGASQVTDAGSSTAPSPSPSTGGAVPPVGSPAPTPAPPAVTLPPGVFTDLASAPVGAFVTVYGIDSSTASWPVVMHGSNKTVVRIPDANTPLSINGQTIPVAVHTGRVIQATPATMAQIYANLIPGDTIYLRAGTYSGKYDTENWNQANFVVFKQGTAAQPIALVAYPGETVTIDNSGPAGASRPNFYLGDGAGRRGSYLTIAGLNMVAQQDCIFGGGYTSDSSRPEMGAAYVRVVGNTCSIVDAVSNTMTAMIALQGDGWKVLGNVFYNPPSRAIINNNHAIYVAGGADDVEIAYNVLRNLRMGHVIQVHQDGIPMLYERISIHHNLLESANRGDMRGITVSNVDDASTITIANNTLRNLGQDFSAVAVYRGQVTLTNNQFYDIEATGLLLLANGFGGNRLVTATGNRFGALPGTPYVAFDPGIPASAVRLNGNSYCGNGAPPSSDGTASSC